MLRQKNNQPSTNLQKPLSILEFLDNINKKYRAMDQATREYRHTINLLSYLKESDISELKE